MIMQKDFGNDSDDVVMMLIIAVTYLVLFIRGL